MIEPTFVVRSGDRERLRFTASGLAAGLAALAVGLRWRGSDLPAQLFRADLIRRNGMVLWNNLWYGGHATAGYGLLTPALGALTSPLFVAAVSTVVATDLVGRILRDAFGRGWQLGAIVFAIGAAVNLVVGRVPFALGLAIGLMAVRLLQRDRSGLGAVAGLAASSASPVAGVFVALAAVAWAASRREQRVAGLVVAAITAAPVIVSSLLYPGEGHFPLRGAGLVWDLVVTAGVAATACWSRSRTLMFASGLYAIACVVAFVIPNPLGGNVSRLAQFAAAPTVLVLLHRRARVLLTTVAVAPLLVWLCLPAVDAVVAAGKDPSTQKQYYEPLVTYLGAQHGAPARTEIPFTFRHWETFYVADALPLARGWERQIDRSRNPTFYDGTLTATGYRSWLHDNAVGFVALPDARLDRSSIVEKRLLEAGVPGLEEVWHNRHWRLWRVNDSTGLVDGPGDLLQLGATEARLKVTASGDLLVHLRYSSHWNVTGSGCVSRGPGGWTKIRGVQPGIVTLSYGLLSSGGGARCGS